MLRGSAKAEGVLAPGPKPVWGDVVSARPNLCAPALYQKHARRAAGGTRGTARAGGARKTSRAREGPGASITALRARVQQDTPSRAENRSVGLGPQVRALVHRVHADERHRPARHRHASYHVRLHNLTRHYRHG